MKTACFVTIYRHKKGGIWVELNKTAEGQEKFIKSLNKSIFKVEGVTYQEVEE